MTKKTKQVLNLVLSLLICIAVLALIVVIFIRIDKLENKNINLEIKLSEAEVKNAVLEEQLKIATKDGYYDAKFVETLMEDVETFTEYLISYVKLNGTDNGFEEWLIKYDKPLYDKMMYYDDIYESRKK